MHAADLIVGGAAALDTAVQRLLQLHHELGLSVRRRPQLHTRSRPHVSMLANTAAGLNNMQLVAVAYRGIGQRSPRGTHCFVDFDAVAKSTLLPLWCGWGPHETACMLRRAGAHMAALPLEDEWRTTAERITPVTSRSLGKFTGIRFGTRRQCGRC